MTESLRILEETRKTKVLGEVEDEFKNIQEKKLVEQRGMKSGASFSPSKKKQTSEWEN